MTELAADEWLTRVTGMNCFRLPGLSDPAGLRDLQRQLPRGRCFVYAKVPPAMVGTLAALCGAGFSLVDTNVVLELASNSAAPAVAASGDGIRRAATEDHDAAQSVAGSCFEYSRFHLDPQFGKQTAHKIKREWVKSYCEGSRGEELLIARHGGRVAGFLAVLAQATAGRRVAVIDLIGVDRGIQQQGIGDALVATFITGWSRKAEILRVGTQLANRPSLRLYQKHGFRVVDSAYVLHGHFHDGQTAR